MTAVIEAEGLGKRYRRQWALTDCTLTVPAGHVVGLVGLNGAGKTTLLNLATGMVAPTTGTIAVLGGRPAAGPAAGQSRVPGPGRAGLSRALRRRAPQARRATQPGLGRSAGPPPDRSARPRPAAQGREALRRPARAAGADPRPRQAARAADPGRAGGQPRPARPTRVPAGPDGNRGRGAGQHRALLAPDQRPGTRLRLPDRAGRLAGAGRRAGRRAAGRAPPAVRPAPRRGQAARPGCRSSPAATPTGRARCWCGRTRPSSTRPGRCPRSGLRTWCSPT